MGNHPLGRLRHALAPDGTLVLNAGGEPGHFFGAVGARLGAALTDLVVRQQLKSLPTAQTRDELLALTARVEAGTLRAVVERTYPLAEAPAALAHVEGGHARGKVVLIVD